MSTKSRRIWSFKHRTSVIGKVLDGLVTLMLKEIGAWCEHFQWIDTPHNSNTWIKLYQSVSVSNIVRRVKIHTKHSQTVVNSHNHKYSWNSWTDASTHYKTPGIWIVNVSVLPIFGLFRDDKPNSSKLQIRSPTFQGFNPDEKLDSPCQCPHQEAHWS